MLMFVEHHNHWGDRLNYDESVNTVKHENMKFQEILDLMIWGVYMEI